MIVEWQWIEKAVPPLWRAKRGNMNEDRGSKVPVLYRHGPVKQGSQEKGGWRAERIPAQ